MTCCSLRRISIQRQEKQKAEFEFRALASSAYSWTTMKHGYFCGEPRRSNVRQLTSSQGYDAEGSYSPDGKKIVFCSLREAYQRIAFRPKMGNVPEADPSYFGEIYIMNADGLINAADAHTGYDGGPFFSPDGQRIIWRRFDKDGAMADVYTMKTDGSDVTRLTDFKAMSWAPIYHPSGQHVVFTSNKLGFSNFELYRGRGQREPVRVTFTDGFDGLPVFSAGRRFCWTSNRTSDGKSQLFLANWNHEAALTVLAQAPPRSASTARPHAEHGTPAILRHHPRHIPPPPKSLPQTFASK
jgi:Tol biopolymer transport system component